MPAEEREKKIGFGFLLPLAPIDSFSQFYNYIIYQFLPLLLLTGKKIKEAQFRLFGAVKSQKIGLDILLLQTWEVLMSSLTFSLRHL